MKKRKLFFLGLLIFLLAGCNIIATPESIKPEPIPDLFNNNAGLDPVDELNDDFSNWNFYSLELGRTDPDIQSQKIYTFYLPKNIEFELLGVDAQSTILEFKKDNKLIFEWHNRDYVVNEDNFEIMYPEWNNYSFVGGHTNVLFFDEVNNGIYLDDLYVFEGSLKVNNQLVFE